jgi:hypothetical protein
MSDEDAPEMPCCPSCQAPMAFVRSWPKSSGFPEYRSYQCACGETVTVQHEQPGRTAPAPNAGIIP